MVVLLNQRGNFFLMIKKLIKDFVCPACGKTVPAWSYDGLVSGRCFETGKQIEVEIKNEKPIKNP